MKIVDFNGVHRSYGRGADVLNGVSFSLDPGQVVGLVGRNGAGKTTLIRIAMGMLAPEQGSVEIFGLDPRHHATEIKQRVGYVSEDQILPPFLRVKEVLALHRGLYASWDDGLARDLAERFSVPMNPRIKSLSKGQARQVALLCAVSHRPELLILDEPAGGLDPAARREFLETSIQLLNDAGTTILFSSHYMTDVERLADRIVMLHEGQVLIDSGLDSLRETYSLALIPHDTGVGPERLLSLENCLGVRKRTDALHAIFRIDPEECRRALQREFNVTTARCSTVALEEMFIELAGGQS